MNTQTTRKIKLTQGKYAIVDDRDFSELSKYKWFVRRQANTFYAMRMSRKSDGFKNRRAIDMHRQIMGHPAGMEIDHINRNGLDNRRENLRVCTHRENKRNCGMRPDNTSGYKGVVYHSGAKKWMANIWNDQKRVYLGVFTKKELAAKAYNEAAIKYHGNFASLNKI